MPTNSLQTTPLVQEILKTGTYTALLAPATTSAAARELLLSADPGQLFSFPIVDGAAAWAALASLWLWHDGLNECHEIVQQSASNLHRRLSQSQRSSRSTGALTSSQLSQDDQTLSFWHAIVHRREGDFWNSKYWYAKCRNHPALAEIAAQAHPLCTTSKSARLVRGGGWDSDGFVDLVEEVSASSHKADKELAAAIQKIEWRALFDFSVQAAIGNR